MPDSPQTHVRFGWYIPTHGDLTNFADPDEFIPASMEMFDRVSLAAEAAGFEYALVPVTPTCWEAWISTAMMSARTTKLKMLVAARPGYILPTQMARMIAAFDQLSQGRVYINLIAGGNPRDLAGDGITFSHDERYEVMDESVEVMKALWTSDERIDWNGKHFQLHGAVAHPKPLQQPYPRFYIGGESDAARDVGAKHADCYLFWGDTPERTALKVADICRRADGFGRESINFGMRMQVCVRETENDAWDAAHRLIAGTTDRQREVRKTWRGDSQADSRMWQLTEESRDNDYRIAPHLWSGLSTVRGGAGLMIVGNPQQVADTLQQFIDIGCTEFCLSGYPHDEEATLFGDLVMPLVHDRNSVEATGQGEPALAVAD